MEPLNTSPSYLSPQQTNVWTLLAKGLTNREIGNRLGIAEKTVKSHLTEIFKHLQVKNCRQAIMKFYTDPLVIRDRDRALLPHGDSL